ncbi:MAG: MarR family transcriptional regulator [Thermomicrobiales bacterium]
MSRRDELIEAMDLAGRSIGAAAILFHSKLSDLLDISITEEKALDLLQRFGPMTARELSSRSGLAPASVTALIDRLERKGFALRTPNPSDGRSVLVAFDSGMVSRFAPFFEEFMTSLHALYERYSDDELTLIAGFMNEAAARQSAATVNLGMHSTSE